MSIIHKFLFLLFFCLTTGSVHSVTIPMITPNQFEGSDSYRINKAIEAAKKTTNRIVIPNENANGTNIWMIDSAILLPSGMTVILDNAILKLSDRCRDNMFRSDNVGVGITNPQWNQDIRIIGVGEVFLQGANNPRATGDANGPLSTNPQANTSESYGSDAADKSLKQTSDWRSIMILMGYVDGFKLENVNIENAHSWAISFERSKNVFISDVSIISPEFMEVNGDLVKVDNRDGINLRQGCKNFHIENVRGVTGDDFIAMTSLDYPDYYACGDVNSHQVTPMKWNGPEDDIENIYINDINCLSQYRGVALRVSDEARIQNIYINGLYYKANPDRGRHNALLVGGNWLGKSAKPGHINNVHASNIIGEGDELILVESAIYNCSFKNSVFLGPGDAIVRYNKIDWESCENVLELNLTKSKKFVND